MMRLTEVFKFESSRFQPSTRKIEPEDVQQKMPDAWAALEKKVKSEFGYQDVSPFIFDTDDAGVLWAINDHNLFWNDKVKEWEEWEEDEPPHWKK